MVSVVYLFVIYNYHGHIPIYMTGIRPLQELSLTGNYSEKDFIMIPNLDMRS